MICRYRPGQEVYVQGRGWVETSQLQVGDPVSAGTIPASYKIVMRIQADEVLMPEPARSEGPTAWQRLLEESLVGSD